MNRSDEAPTQARPAAAWAQPVRERWAALCALLIAAGALLVALSLAGWLPRDGLAAFVGGFLALYGGIVGLQRAPASWISRSLQRRLRTTLVSSGVGFYGVMTLARFLQLELHDLIGSLGSLELTRGLVRSLLQDWLIGFSAQSLRNSIEAFMWPLLLIKQYEIAVAAAAIGATWAVYALGARIFPEVHAVIESERDDEDDDADFDLATDAAADGSEDIADDADLDPPHNPFRTLR